MAISITTLQNERKTSIYGRRLGLAKVNGHEYLQGSVGLREPVTELTSGSTATAIGPGVTIINVTSAATTATGGAFLLPLPVPGARIMVGTGVRGTTSTQGSTAIALIRPSTAFEINSSEGSTMTTVLLPFGTVVELLGQTTAHYKVVGGRGLFAVNGTT